jgi:TM2 domain-containing membrane protein YozV
MAEKSKGVALLLSTFFGIFGADKFYVGATSQGVVMLILTIIIIGIPISSVWASLSVLTLLLTILFGINTFLYPQVNWAPTTQFDKNVAYVVGFCWVLMILVSVFGSKSAYERYKLRQKEKYEKNKNKKN